MTDPATSIFRPDALLAHRDRGLGEVLESRRSISLPVVTAIAGLVLATTAALGSARWPATVPIAARVVHGGDVDARIELALTTPCSTTVLPSGEAYLGRGRHAPGATVHVALAPATSACRVRAEAIGNDASRTLARLRTGDAVELELVTGMQDFPSFVRAQLAPRVEGHAR